MSDDYIETPIFSQRDKQRLEGVHPDLWIALEETFRDMRAIGCVMFVVEGVRTLERQQALYAQGRTTPGPIVTHADGVHVPSNHQVKQDGYGHAVDCAFAWSPQVPIDSGLSAEKGSKPFDGKHPWATFGDRVKLHGMKWGGDFSTFPDKPHVEMP